ncbi:uncharacterized protein LOC117119085 [Anneissia japonica]|uniref:uncharacterized protein LOC117119085 n=1 Tax=Anneissia japonica TaxID=1529436 RepID=UPI0014257511|nr:uncharacterized protein LOC117119085 [Anneissia japonica]
MYARDAFFLCLKRGTIPLTIEDDQEHQDVLNAIVNAKGYTNVVLGVAYMRESRSFKWLDNSTYNFTAVGTGNSSANNFWILKKDGLYYETGEDKTDVEIVCKVKIIPP